MAKKQKEVDIVQVGTETATFHILGRTPFVCNAMSQKVKRDLIMPPQKRRGKQREQHLKHNPIEEYRRSPYKAMDDDAPTRIVFPSSAFKQAMATAAKEMPGVTGAGIKRLCWAEGFNVSLYGVPQMWMTTVRNSDVNRTPDVRTRAILPEWCATVEVTYITPNLRHQPVVNLMASAGIMVGVGDGRPEKGAMSFGQFEIVDPDNEDFKRVMKSGGLKAQDQALETPTFYDSETEELYEWFVAEVARRGFEVEVA